MSVDPAPRVTCQVFWACDLVLEFYENVDGLWLTVVNNGSIANK